MALLFSARLQNGQHEPFQNFHWLRFPVRADGTDHNVLETFGGPSCTCRTTRKVRKDAVAPRSDNKSLSQDSSRLRKQQVLPSGGLANAGQIEEECATESQSSRGPRCAQSLLGLRLCYGYGH